jgi:AMMECR1 domain-containing protein
VAATAARPVNPRAPWRPLAARLTEGERDRVFAACRRLLAFARTLERWPSLSALERHGRLPDATAFVSLYSGGKLRGCYGSHEGGPTERLLRAFLAATHDPRFGGIAAKEPGLTAQVSYLRSLRRVPADRIEGVLEPGSDGVGLVTPAGAATLLLPQVARESGLDAPMLLDRLARKAGLTGAAELRAHQLFVFRSEDVVIRESRPRPARGAGSSSIEMAAAWLSRLVDARGDVLFAIDARSGARSTTGTLHHGRSAMVVRALLAHGGFATVAARAQARLAEDVRRGLRGGALLGWPAESDRMAGTLALATLAGIDMRAELRAFLDAHAEVAASPWHAAQCVAALGPAAPPALWRACVDDLRVRPWAPWTALAARAMQDGETLGRAVAALVGALRAGGTFAGGAGVTALPELALTAITVEALAGLPTQEARAGCRRGRRFLRRWQMAVDRAPAAVDPTLAAGAFPASPVSFHLRADITAHALLALLRW